MGNYIFCVLFFFCFVLPNLFTKRNDARIDRKSNTKVTLDSLSHFDHVVIEPCLSKTNVVKSQLMSLDHARVSGVSFALVLDGTRHHCGGILRSHRGIECGHAFILGEKVIYIYLFILEKISVESI